MIELSQEFTFEAAHFFPFMEEGHENRRLHGHSFRAVVTLAGTPDQQRGILIHLDDFLNICLKNAKEKLDHRFLNEIEGLQNPTLENISVWIYKALEKDLPYLKKVCIYRDTCGQSCCYSPS